ncbi:hypothetical protein BS47DRAFT_1402977 [Hydnum rufescens UP504]|uniref:Uncharacterized protein n=1 Tax=Hydnum rufescens UP504 TaxID=1448309 RepID=A0A9P6AB37_9AGAM|nr:hypothetical protein BS47DRAFT_1402977 [Hydnum rufescens UP504]
MEQQYGTISQIRTEPCSPKVLDRSEIQTLVNGLTERIAWPPRIYFSRRVDVAAVMTWRAEKCTIFPPGAVMDQTGRHLGGGALCGFPFGTQFLAPAPPVILLGSRASAISQRNVNIVGSQIVEGAGTEQGRQWCGGINEYVFKTSVDEREAMRAALRNLRASFSLITTADTIITFPASASRH